MESPLVSVVLPNYNNGPYLREAIDSILNQTFPDFEFIIIDDCSTDNSIEIIESYSDPRIILKVKEKNSGIVDSLNIGLDIAKGEYMLRMDGDDISTPDRMEKLLRFMEENPSIGVCSSAIQNFGLVDDLWKFEADPQKNKAMLLFGHGIGHASSIFRMIFFREHGVRYRNGYPFVEDYKLFTELSEFADFNCINEPLYKYRRLPHTSTIANEETLRDRIGLIHIEVLNQLLDRTASSDELYIHFNLYRGVFDRPLIEYFNWSKILLKSNSSNCSYPTKEFIDVIESKMERILFKSLDKSVTNIFKIIYHVKSIKFKQMRYVIGILWKNEK